MDKIYLKLNKKPETLKELIEVLFSFKSGSETVKAVATYFNEECTLEQCKEKSNRSFEDIRIIVDTYLNDISDNEIIKQLVLHRPINLSGNKTYIQGFYCDTPKRIIFLYHNDTFVGGNGYQYTLSEYGFNDRLSMAELPNTDTALKEYIDNNS
jgi:hypothetical protein